MNRHRWFKIALPVGVLVLALTIAVVMTVTRPEPEKAEGRTATLVEVQRFDASERRVVVPAAGEVQPAVQTSVLPQVQGRVVEVHPDLVPGGVIQEGEVLLQLERDDFQLRVRQQRTQLEQARAEYRLELGRSKVAQREWQLFADELDAAQRDAALALREPQLAAAKARVDAAEIALEEAKLALRRTSIEAPFDCIVLSESVDLGQFVSPQSVVAELVGADVLWVQAAIHATQVPLITIDPETGSPAQVRYDSGGRVVTRTGRVTRLLPNLEDTGRMARVLIEMRALPDDPNEREQTELPLLLDAWVDVRIAGNRSRRGIELPREYLHDGDEVFVYEDDRLAVRNVEIAWETPESVFVTAGLGETDRVVTSRLASPIAGMPLRLESGSERSKVATASAPE